ncbi:ABC transporter ATP-binding protein [Litorivicinus lipolyticus]|uniref:ABC transporter ATP-binding protein n=1 Tax=Litorivicinus lipolyticus TaxID=418701 RepID=UPI001B85E823|nr:ABC transporter ATP-binding protein [Litorivicinus lipolyticus]
MGQLPADSRLTLSGISKRFPGVLANDAVDFTVAPGEIHALLGENGAGKSTLVKMIYGVMRPDAGVMQFNGAPFAPSKPAQARDAGVGMVFQHFSLFEALTVAENVALGVPPELARGDLNDRVAQISHDYGLPLDPRRAVGDLSVGERQRVEIVRALLQSPSLLIMDEPTSVLTPQEVERLFETLNRLRSEGCSVLYISHKLDEVKTLCDHATILRGGRVVAHCQPAQESAASMAELMLGERLVPAQRAQSADAGPVRLRADGLELASESPFGVGLRGLSFEARGGEILGVAGVAGNGQDAMIQALLGERTLGSGRIELDGVDVTTDGPSVRRQRGLCGTPEERLGHAAVPSFSLTENTLLSARERQHLAPSQLINPAAAADFAQQVIQTFGVKTPSAETYAASLSGGNLQKFVVGREVLQTPEVYVVCQPTWGVDAHAAAMIRQALVDMAARGTAVIVISQDLDELLEISTRIGALYLGQMSDTIDAADASAQKLGEMMLGAAAV